MKLIKIVWIWTLKYIHKPLKIYLKKGTKKKALIRNTYSRQLITHYSVLNKNLSIGVLTQNKRCKIIPKINNNNKIKQ